MKKVARLRITPEDSSTKMATTTNEQIGGVRTTGRIKKPKAVFDPSDNYLPRYQRGSVGASVSPAMAATSPSSVAIGSERKRETSVQSALDAYPDKRLSESSGTSTTPNSQQSDPVEVCSVCQKREAKRGTHAKNKLVTCLDCEKRVHKMCLEMDFDDFDTLRANFKCENCRSCEICDTFSDIDSKKDCELVTCAKCIKSYHLTCHIPNVLKYQHHRNRKWKCNKCTVSTAIIGNGSIMPVKTIREIIGDEPKKLVKVPEPSQVQKTPPPPVNIAAAAAEAKTAAVKRTQQELVSVANGAAKSDLGETTTKKQKLDNDDDEVVAAPAVVAANASENASTLRYSPNEPIDVLPDVKYWTVEQVAEFLAKYFPNEAHVFKEHEIDGMSLLLLKRSDVIKKLPIKLGPSLRIYSLILKIQTQLNDSTLGWNCGLQIN